MTSVELPGWWTERCAAPAAGGTPAGPLTYTRRMARRPIQPIPPDVIAALEERNLGADYRARPFYQRNDYLGWIGRAKRPETRRRRIEQMLDELERGGVYMGMSHRPSQKL